MHTKTPAVNIAPCSARDPLRRLPSTSCRILRIKTGKTQGMRFRMRPPKNAKATAAFTDIETEDLPSAPACTVMRVSATGVEVPETAAGAMPATSPAATGSVV